MSAEAAAIELARSVSGEQTVWLVGGVVRERLLARPPTGAVDLDLIIEGDAERFARALRAAAPRGTALFALSDQFGAWRLRDGSGEWQVDCTPLQGETLEDDLRSRDLTINAIAEPLEGGDLIDPTGGVGDLDRGLLRAADSGSFNADALRVVRLVRFATDLGFEIEARTLAAATAAADGLTEVAGERIFAELNAILAAPAAVAGFELLREIGACELVLPELCALGGLEQTAYHHLDTYDHTLEVLQQAIELEQDPKALFGEAPGARVGALLAEPLADGLTRAGGLRWAALLHDIAKPQTRAEFDDGRVGFPGHDVEGARIARQILERLRASERLRAHVAKMTAEHLRLGFLVHEMPLTRAAVYRYLTGCEPVEVDVTLLSLVDRLATRGRKAEPAIAVHEQLASELLAQALDWRDNGPPKPLWRGDELAAELGIAPGPQLGELLELIAEGQFCGDLEDPQQALELARRSIGDER